MDVSVSATVKAACDFDAIHICDGVAVVNRDNCVGCGVCAKTCPNAVIKIQSAKNLVVVQCKSEAKGAVTREKLAPTDVSDVRSAKRLVSLMRSLWKTMLPASIQRNAKLRTLCKKECPTGAINNMSKKAPAKPAAQKRKLRKKHKLHI